MPSPQHFVELKYFQPPIGLATWVSHGPLKQQKSHWIALASFRQAFLSLWMVVSIYLGDNLNSNFSLNNQIPLATESCRSYLLNAFWINSLLMMSPVTSVFQVFITSHLNYVKGLQLASFPPAFLPYDLLSMWLPMWPSQNIILSMSFLGLKYTQVFEIMSNPLIHKAQKTVIHSEL